MADDPLRNIPRDLIAQWERYGVDAVAADLENEHKGGRRLVTGPQGTGVQAHRWVKFKRAQAEAQAERKEQERAKFIRLRRERAEAKREQRRAKTEFRRELERTEIRRREWERSEAARLERERAEHRDIVTAKPGLWGFSIDLKAAWRVAWPRIKDWGPSLWGRRFS